MSHEGRRDSVPLRLGIHAKQVDLSPTLGGMPLQRDETEGMRSV